MSICLHIKSCSNVLYVQMKQLFIIYILDWVSVQIQVFFLVLYSNFILLFLIGGARLM